MKLIHEMDISKLHYHIKLSYSTDTGFPNYYHAHQGMEIVYVHAGQGDILVNQSLYEVQPDSLFIFQPYQLHRIRIHASTKTPFIRSKLLLDPVYFYNRLKAFPTIQNFFKKVWQYELSCPAIYNAGNYTFLPQLLKEYKKHFPLPSDASEKEEESCLFLTQLFQIVQQNWNSILFDANEPQLREHHHAEHIIQWLEQHIHEPLELDRIAEDLHLSKHHISRLFKRATGSTISQYMTIIRIQKARILLETTNQSIEQISQSLGLFNVSYFCEVFKKATGYTPLQYRIFLFNHP